MVDIDISKYGLSLGDRNLLKDLILECEAIALEYAKIARGVVLGNLGLKEKSTPEEKRIDPVTAADYEIQGLISGGVRSRFPKMGFVGEEQDQDKGLRNIEPDPNFWPQIRVVVDPLDGTRAFKGGHQHYSVCNLAFQMRNKPGDEWQTFTSVSSAPELGISVFADNVEGVTVRRGGGTNIEMIDEIRKVYKSSELSLVIKGVTLDLRLVGNEEKELELHKAFQDKKMCVRNSGAVLPTFLQLLLMRQEEAAVIAGKGNMDETIWDWLPGQHFLRLGGWKAELVTFKNGLKTDQGYRDYPVFLAAGSEKLFNYLYQKLEKALAPGQIIEVPTGHVATIDYSGVVTAYTGRTISQA